MRNAYSCLLLTGVLLVLIFTGPAAAPAQPNGPADASANWSTEGDFRVAVNRWVSVTFLTEGNRVRQVCADLARTQDIAVVLDRRLDPSRPVLLEPPVAGKLSDVVDRVAATQDATVRVIGDCLYILPDADAGPFATLVELRTDEIKSAATRRTLKFSSSQLTRLTQARPRVWNSFARPRDLLEQTARECNLKISNPELLRHDLWFAGALPNANPIEFLSFILFQYDLTFAWKPGGELELQPIPDDVSITRTHRLPLAELNALKVELVSNFPDAIWTQRDNRIEITGPAELHAALEAKRNGEEESTPRIRWNNRVFTMRVQQKPLGEVLKYLQQAGIPVVFDAEELKQAGFDPDQLINFEVSKADAEGLMSAICDPLKLPWKIEATGILIGPAQSPVIQDKAQD
ncbi:hypothetical protein [Rubinisphaera sp. JC750]|uniref:hypothetical protein n=1 Tax=Rubinisphaera sp. JC750 TaxID=2898658 RepID=UPI001F4538DF|nr:hypothetical protein [Rubinisphaera sp. JC750]